MANTFTQLYYHIVFAVEDRQSILTHESLSKISRYIWGTIESMEGMPFIINGYRDHIHILSSIPPTISVSDFIRQLKTQSSKFSNKENLFKGRFGWQNGYGAFSVSKSNLKNVIKYIENQEEHHYNKSFKDEYISLLKKHGIEYDVKYIFKDISD